LHGPVVRRSGPGPDASGTGPLVSWIPSSTGTADYYIVDIERLQISGTSVTFAQAATLRTTEAQAQFPAATLAGGNQ